MNRYFSCVAPLLVAGAFLFPVTAADAAPRKKAPTRAKKPAAKPAKKPVKKPVPRVAPAADNWNDDWQDEAAPAAVPKKDVVKAEAWSETATPIKKANKLTTPAPRIAEIPNYLVQKSSAQTALLAENGKALMPIVVADEASKASVKELQDYLKRITGAEFSVEVGDGKSGIVVGTLAQFPDASLNKVLELRGATKRDGRESYAIRTEGKRVRLIGGDAPGMLEVQYRFLELLGVRWFFPAEHWTVVPSEKKLSFNTDLSDRPVFLNRGVWSSWGFFGDNPDKRWEREYGKARSATEYLNWARHNNGVNSFSVNTGHSWFEIIKKNNDLLTKNPENFALVGGKRTVHWEAKLDLGSPQARQVIIDYALDYFKNNPDADMVSVDPSDGGGWSESAESKAYGATVSDQVFRLANEVAVEVQKKYPGKMVGLLAYNFHSMPPSFALEPNIYVQMPTAFIQGKYTLEDLIRLWPQKAKNFGFYEYYSVWLWRRDFLPGGTAANVPGLVASIQNYAKTGATALSAESGNDWGLSGRGYYIASKVMWNPNADVAALSQDFYEKAFGAGANAMQRYYERVEGANKSYLSRNTYGLALRDVDEAGRLAKDDAAATKRIDDIKQYLRYQHLNWEWERVNALVGPGVVTPEKAVAWDARIEQTYRERFSYMTHFMAQLSNGYADWDYIGKNPDKFPDKPYSRAERDAQWQEMIATYKPLETHERAFSSDLVAARLPGTAVEARQHFAGRAGFWFVSKGEPIEITIQTDLLPGFEGRPDASYTLSGGKGFSQTGKMQFDGKANTLKWDVPAGTYSLDFDGAQGSWTLIAPPNLAFSQMLLKQWPRQQQGPLQDMYFYVPKGTKQIEFASATALNIVDSNGAAAKVSANNHDIYILDVPAGTDGKAWKIVQFGLGQLWFYNIPSYLSPSPNSLVIPREVANSDGIGAR